MVVSRKIVRRENMTEERSVEETLTEQIDEVPWNVLQPHAMKDRLLILHESLELITVATAVAKDQVTDVQRWVEEGKLQKPSLDDFGKYGTEPQTNFHFLIVQPFVLAKIISD